MPKKFSSAKKITTSKKHFNPVVASVIIAALLISSALAFLAYQVKTNLGQAAIEKGIQKFIDQQKNGDDTERKASETKAQTVRTPDASDHVRGDASATISLIEYSDFECPYCKRFHPTAKSFVEKYSGKVNWIYRQFPLPFHDPVATNEAIAAECVAALSNNETFWKFADEIYTKTKSNGSGAGDLTTLAGSFGVKKADFVKCAQDEKIATRVKKDIAEGSAAGVEGTPGNILRNNKTGEVRFIPGAYPLEALEQAMKELNSEK